MPNLTLEQWSQLAPLAIALVAFLGIGTSMWMSVRALREVEKDRYLRYKPYLAFAPGGRIVPVEFVRQGRAVPGVDRRYAEQALANIPKDTESVAIKHEQVKVTEEGRELVRPVFYGRLKNYGVGPALVTNVRWVPEEITIGAESFEIDECKLREPVYSLELNTMPASPQHIESNGEAELTRLPTFIAKDVDKKVTVVVGRLTITCKDIFGRDHLAIQKFRIGTEYSREQPHLLFTFGDILHHAEDHGDT